MIEIVLIGISVCGFVTAKLNEMYIGCLSMGGREAIVNREKANLRKKKERNGVKIQKKNKDRK